MQLHHLLIVGSMFVIIYIMGHVGDKTGDLDCHMPYIFHEHYPNLCVYCHIKKLLYNFHLGTTAIAYFL